MTRSTLTKVPVLPSLLCAALLTASWVSLPQARSRAEHVRGTVVSIDAAAIVVATANGSVRLKLAPETGFASVVKSDRQHITDGSFLGIASITATDGSQRATGVTILPEAQRASAEGQFDWDLPGTAAANKMTNGTPASSKMTNGTASAAAVGALTLQFKDGGNTGRRRSPSLLTFPSSPWEQRRRPTCSAAHTPSSSSTAMRAGR